MKMCIRDRCCIDKESVIPLLKGGIMLYEATGFERYLKMAQKAAWYLSTWQWHQSVVYPSDSILGKMGYEDVYKRQVSGYMIL